MPQKRGKWPSYDVEGHEDDFNRRSRLIKTIKKGVGGWKFSPQAPVKGTCNFLYICTHLYIATSAVTYSISCNLMIRTFQLDVIKHFGSSDCTAGSYHCSWGITNRGFILPTVLYLYELVTKTWIVWTSLATHAIMILYECVLSRNTDVYKLKSFYSKYNSRILIYIYLNNTQTCIFVDILKLAGIRSNISAQNCPCCSLACLVRMIFHECLI